MAPIPLLLVSLLAFHKDLLWDRSCICYLLRRWVTQCVSFSRRWLADLFFFWFFFLLFIGGLSHSSLFTWYLLLDVVRRRRLSLVFKGTWGITGATCGVCYKWTIIWCSDYCQVFRCFRYSSGTFVSLRGKEQKREWHRKVKLHKSDQKAWWNDVDQILLLNL